MPDGDGERIPMRVRNARLIIAGQGGSVSREDGRKRVSRKTRDFNPTAFIGVGVCFMGSGVALTAALSRGGAGAVGISLIGLGAVFMILGFRKKRELESRDSERDDDGRSPT